MPPEIVRARGIVRARVWYEGYGECRRTSKKVVYTGRESRQVVVRTPWRDFTLMGAGDPGFEQFSQKISNKAIDSPLGTFGWIDMTAREKKTIVRHISENEAVKIARENAIKNLQGKMADGKRHQDLKVEILSSPS